MSAYTDARSKPGQQQNAGDERELFMTHFGGVVLEAYDETFDFGSGKTYMVSIDTGKSWDFPIIGRKRDASDHVPGEVILGGGIEHNKVTISVDNITVDAAFIAEIDELMNHYNLSNPYGRQLGESLANVSNGRIARTAVLASRVTDAPYTGGPLPSYAWHANMATDPAQLEEAAFAGLEHIKENDIGGGKPTYYLPWKQQLLLARYTGIDTVDTSGSGNRAAGTVGQVASMDVEGTNSIPNANYISDTFAKYNGDFSTTVGIIFNPMAVGSLKRRGKKVTMTNQEDRLGTLLIASQLEGHGILRPETSFEVASASR